MNGKVCLVTGATSGIGRVTAEELAGMGATVIVAGRNPEKTRTAVEEITSATGNPSVEQILADLSVQEEVRKLAREFKERYDRLDVLVNNAGAIFQEYGETADGIERTFAVDHLSYFLLTNLLLDELKAAAPSRVVNVSSAAHERATLNFDDLGTRRRYHFMKAYGRAKLANVLFTYELSRRLAGIGVTANALHPGAVATGFGSNNQSLFARVVMTLFRAVATSPERGARTSVYLASSPDVEGVTGRYFTKEKPVNSSPVSYDADVARRLWEVSGKMVGLSEEEMV